MRPKHFLLHAVRHTPRKVQSNPHDEIREHIRKALSREQLTKTLKKRLVEKRKRDALHEQLHRMEHELLSMRGEHEERVGRLQRRIEELKKKVE